MSWSELLLQAGMTFFGGGAALAGGLWLSKRWLDHRLQAEMEHLKRDLNDSLAQRSRRADYVRGQIENLYGPLGFLVESSAQCIETERSIMAARGKLYTRLAPNERFQQEARQTFDRAKEYLDLVVENNQEAIKVLRTGWGWMDADDIPDAGQYMTDVHRYNVEFREPGKMLAVEIYSPEILPGAPGFPSHIRSAFIERVRRKLREKQAELAGLTGAVAAVVTAGAVQLTPPPAASQPVQLPPVPDLQLSPMKPAREGS
jgi:hypothetical protein